MFEKQIAQELVRLAKEIESYNPRFPRTFYMPKGKGVRVTPKGVDMMFYVYDEEDRTGKMQYYALAFEGKAQKPLWHNSFRTEAQRERKIKDAIAARKRFLDDKKQRQEEKTNYRHDYKVGDILYSSWGYDQTNVDYYQVVSISEKTVKIREIRSKIVRDVAQAEYVAPVPNRFEGPAMQKRPTSGGSIRLTSYSRAYKWDGKPKYQTAAPFGH